jgi:hypothetical protein
MYIKNEDLEFLIELERKLWSFEGWTFDVERLWTLNERIIQSRESARKKTLSYITKKRKTNPNYCRSKKEIENRQKAIQKKLNKEGK